MTTGLKILIVGGYGVFGSRIVKLFESDSRRVAHCTMVARRALCALLHR
jgi:hypothetical protein